VDGPLPGRRAAAGLFLGRMTKLADGMSVILEAPAR
jgi:hypothetical protein